MYCKSKSAHTYWMYMYRSGIVFGVSPQFWPQSFTGSHQFILTFTCRRQVPRPLFGFPETVPLMCVVHVPLPVWVCYTHLDLYLRHVCTTYYVLHVYIILYVLYLYVVYMYTGVHRYTVYRYSIVLKLKTREESDLIQLIQGTVWYLHMYATCVLCVRRMNKRRQNSMQYSEMIAQFRVYITGYTYTYY